ncbi:unnamed protein product [Ascophyllum nodosum]
MINRVFSWVVYSAPNALGLKHLPSLYQKGTASHRLQAVKVVIQMGRQGCRRRRSSYTVRRR